VGGGSGEPNKLFEREEENFPSWRNNRVAVPKGKKAKKGRDEWGETTETGDEVKVKP